METIEDDETATEPTDEEDNDTVTSVPPKRPTGTDLGLDNLTTAPLGERGKLIFKSCRIDFFGPTNPRDIIKCRVSGASPGDNVVVSSTALDIYRCNVIASSEVSQRNFVSIKLVDATPSHSDPSFCQNVTLRGPVIFSIIVFRPVVPDIIGSLEELGIRVR